MEMERAKGMWEATTLIVSIMTAMIMMRCAWKMVKRLWLNPKRLERILREQGFKANPYKFWVGDLMEVVKAQEETKSTPMKLSDSHDLFPHVYSFIFHTLNTYGKNSFIWHGPAPKLILTSPELIKEVLNKPFDYTKRQINHLARYLSPGMAKLEGEQWAKRRRTVSPAFNMDKLKSMTPSFSQSCNDMIGEWEKQCSSSKGVCEIDVWPWLQSMSQDAISRTAFGSSYDEGRQIFHLISEQFLLVNKHSQRYYIPFWRLLHGKDLRRIKEIDKLVMKLVKGMVEKKEKAMKEGRSIKKDLLGHLLGSVNNNVGLSMDDVVEECKLFYFGGQITTASMLVWTMMLLAKYTDWQARAREEVLKVFGDQNPNSDGLSQLKIVTMILNEVLRLYTPATWQERVASKDMKLGDFFVPEGVQIFIPTLLFHHDEEIWGSDAKEFKPERFSEGISKAGKGNSSPVYFPFGWGPRICLGQNFTLLEAKITISTILKHFCFELSPSYSHAPIVQMMLQPQHGIHLILRKLE